MDNVEKVLNSLDIAQVINEYIQLKKVGTNFKGLCPFHSEKTPSFIVNVQKGIFKCFGCGIGGNLITFHMKINNIDFTETLNTLAQKYNIELDKSNYKKSPNSISTMLEEAIVFFKSNLFDKRGQVGLEYLLKERGFKKEFLEESNIGLSLNKWDSLIKYLVEKGYREIDILSIGLAKENEDKIYDTFRNRIMFPILNVKGHVVGFGGRAIDNALPKYLNSSESEIFHKGEVLYGLLPKEIRKKEYALLMEGYIDVLSVHSYGFKNAVASLGTSLTEEQSNLLSKYTKNVVLCFDKDNAGVEATEKAIITLKKNSFNIKILDLKSYKDPDDFIRNEGAKKFKEIIKSSIECFDFLYFKYSSKLDLDIVTDKKKFITKFIEFFSSLNSLELEIYLDKLSILIRIDKDVLKSYLSDNKKIYLKDSSVHKRSELTSLEKDTLVAILKSPDMHKDLEKLYKDSPNTELFNYLVYSIKDLNYENIKDYLCNMNLEYLVNESQKNISIEFLDEIIYSWKKRVKKENLSSIEERLLYANKEEKIKLIKEYYNTKKEREDFNG